MTRSELLKLKSSLSHGSLAIIAKRKKKSVSLVTHVLNGERNNDAIIDCAINLAKEQKAAREARSAEIANL